MSEQEQVAEFKCPNCGAPLSFNTATQNLHCDYCGSNYTINQFNQASDDGSANQPVELDWQTNNEEWHADDIVEYVCKSCGGTVITDKTTAATTCPYCDNNMIINDQVSGLLKPEAVIPFKYDKKAAMDAFRKHMQGKKLLPAVFKDENHIEEIKGIYVPYWVYDADIDASVTYRASIVRNYVQGKYDVRETKYYDLKRAGSLQFEAVPVDASSKIDDTMMESIEPFDMKDAVPFATPYLSGYYADRYDVSPDENIVRANERIRQSVINEFNATTAGYTTANPISRTITMTSGKTTYVLYPVWLLNTRWKDKMYSFAMNGQTGKFIGDLPEDKAASRSMTIKTIGIGLIATLIAGIVAGL